jgi:hypothetical protein
MADNVPKKHSIVKLALELVEQSIVLVFLELKLAGLEIKRNVTSVEKGVIFLPIGAVLLLLALLTMIGAAVAALCLVVQPWLAALIVSAVLIFLGTALLFTGLSKIKEFTLIPRETIERVETIVKKLKQHAEERHAREQEQ